ncbi:hypothetical protein [Luteimonas fraxinea]|uniref:Uncharacterized protein n=1 Tax=Luteimonas fraxinea TaxID=2901869 RepID=A0ABS8UAK6_9GAMM|nr:hypothetical protein [Luteimonas fraxinea]MCD9096533.1 hypothetical protein [Luteimonas fraxinea]
MTPEQFAEVACQLIWLSMLSGLLGAFVYDLIRSAWHWIERRIDRRRGHDDFVDAVEAVVRRMERERG